MTITTDLQEALFKAAYQAAREERERASKAKVEFVHLASIPPTKTQRKHYHLNSARTVSVVFDSNTGQLFTCTSGRPHPMEEQIHPELKVNMPARSLDANGRPVQNCAEFKACNQALQARPGARLEDLVIVTLLVGDCSPKARCVNCLQTTRGATVLTDEN